MPRGAWTQYLFIILVVGFSVLSWIVRKVQEQAAKRQVEDRRQHQVEEMLRTGRVEGQEPEAANPAAAREREIAERRRAQIEELRRRARERGARAGQQGPIIMVPSSSGPIVIQGGAPPRQTPAPAPQRRPQAPQRQRVREQPRIGARQQRVEQPRPQPAPRPAEVVEARVAPQATPPEAPRAFRAVIRGAPLTPSDLQRAIVLREVLGPPVSLRGPESVL